MDQLKRQYVFSVYTCIYTHTYFYAYVCTYLTDCCYLPSTFLIEILASSIYPALSFTEMLYHYQNFVLYICYHTPGKNCCMTVLSVLFVVPPVVFKCKIYIYLH